MLLLKLNLNIEQELCETLWLLIHKSTSGSTAVQLCPHQHKVPWNSEEMPKGAPTDLGTILRFGMAASNFHPFTLSASLPWFWVILWLKDRSGSSRFDFSLSYRFVCNLRRSHSASILWVPIYKAVIIIIMLLSFVRVVGDLNFLIFVICKGVYFTDG